MKERLEKVIRYFGQETKVWVVVAAVLVALVVGVLGRGMFAPGAGGDITDLTTDEKGQAQEWWTCSMHPQIKLPKAGLCPICNMPLIPLEIQVESGSLRELTVSENAKKLMGIETALVERRFVEAEVRMVGKIDYDETRLKYITAWIAGRLDRLWVDYTGVPVRKGDHLVLLYSPELLSAQEELLQAIETVKSLSESSISIIRETSEATVVAVREKLRLWGLKPEQIAEIEKRGTVSDHMTIYAPIGGIVIHKNAQEGMYVKTGTRIYTIADLTEVWIRLDAYESDLMWLRYGQKVEFTTEAYPGEEFVGTIAFMDPILTQTTRTVKVRINAKNPKMKLKPGMFVRAIAKSKIASSGKVMNKALAGKWICRMHPDVVKESAGKCDICEMPLVRTESLGYLGVDITTADKPLVIPVSAALVTGGGKAGSRAIVYVEIDPSLLRTVDVGDWAALLGMIHGAAKTPTDGFAGTPFGHFWSLLSDSLREQLLDRQPSETLPMGVRHRFVAKVNDVLRGRTLYQPEIWSGVEIGAEATGYLRRGLDNLPQREVNRFNRLLLERIFPDEIAKGRYAPTFEGQEVVLGPRAGEYYLVRYGLTEGQRVVTKGSFKIDAELQIQAKPSMMTPEGGGGGGPSPGATDTGDGKAPMKLPALVQAQLHALMESGEKIDKAIEAGGLEGIRSAFAAMGRNVKAVQEEKLKGHMRLLWKEYSMLLMNDAVEGKEIEKLPEAKRLVTLMHEHLSSMKSKFGLGDDHGPPKAPVIAPEFRQQFTKAVEAYLAVQQALANDDSKQAVAAAKKMAEAIDAVNMKLLEGEDHMAWMKASGELKKILAGAVQAKGVEPVRKEFALLSEEVAVAVKRFGVSGSSLYKFKCPMAFNNRGATWVQTGQDTRNPYFGSVMLQCGSVIEVLPAVEGGRQKGGDERAAPSEEAVTQPASAPAAQTESTIWTCTMHPQVRLASPGKCPICGMELIPVRQDAKEQGGSDG